MNLTKELIDEIVLAAQEVEYGKVIIAISVFANPCGTYQFSIFLREGWVCFYSDINPLPFHYKSIVCTL